MKTPWRKNPIKAAKTIKVPDDATPQSISSFFDQLEKDFKMVNSQISYGQTVHLDSNPNIDSMCILLDDIVGWAITHPSRIASIYAELKEIKKMEEISNEHSGTGWAFLSTRRNPFKGQVNPNPMVASQPWAWTTTSTSTLPTSGTGIYGYDYAGSTTSIGGYLPWTTGASTTGRSYDYYNGPTSSYYHCKECADSSLIGDIINEDD